MDFLRYMAVMAIDNIPKKEGLHSIRVLEKDIQYVTEEHYAQNRSKLVAIKLASTTIKGEYTHINELYTLLTPSSNVPLHLNEMSERVIRSANDNRECIEVLIRNEILVSYPEDGVEIQLTLRDLDRSDQSYHKTFKPNTLVQRLEDVALTDVRVEDLNDNDIIAWVGMSPEGLIAVTRQVQHNGVCKVDRPELTLIGIALDPSTEDLNNTLHIEEVERLLQDGGELDDISIIIADDMITGYNYTVEHRKQTADEADSELDIKSSTVADPVLSPEEPEVAQKKSHDKQSDTE